MVVKARIQEALLLAVHCRGAKPRHPVSALGSRRATSSHSRFPCSCCAAATTAAAPARSYSIPGYSHFSWARSTVARSNPMQSSTLTAQATATSLLASRSPIVAAESKTQLTPVPSSWPSWVFKILCETLEFATTILTFTISISPGSPLTMVTQHHEAYISSLTYIRVNQRRPESPWTMVCAPLVLFHRPWRSGWRLSNHVHTVYLISFNSYLLSFPVVSVDRRRCQLEVHFSRAMTLVWRSFTFVGADRSGMVPQSNNLSLGICHVRGTFRLFMENISFIGVLAYSNCSAPSVGFYRQFKWASFQYFCMCAFPVGCCLFVCGLHLAPHNCASLID